jgi:serine/threonine protein kinase/Tfp pilus assembly protein PilF
MEGKTVGNYEVLESLGHGGMGTVYKARDRRLRRLVALKFLSDPNVDVTAKARFQREAQAASALSHPNIVAIYDVGQHEGADYIVMEYVEGDPLNRLIPGRGFSAVKALDFLVQIADALSAAHAAGVVHRDLKPGNVIIDRSGRAKVLDFGLAKFSAPKDEGDTQSLALTREGAFVGTTQYISPEQASGADVDHRSDIFALAVMAQELLTGQRPFIGASQWLLLHEIAHGNPRPLRHTHPHLPVVLEELILQMLAKRPQDRIGSMKDVLARLREIRGKAESLDATQELSRVEPVPPAASSPPASAPSSAAAEKPSIGVMMFRSPSPDKDDQYLAEGVTSEIVRALSGVPGVRVVSQLASSRFKEDSGDLSSLARSLNIRYMLTGSVRRAGSKIRVIAEIDDAVAATQLWSQTYDRATDDLFAVQEEVAQAIAAAAGGVVIRDRTEQAAHAIPESLDAAGLVRKAYYFSTQVYHSEALDKALELLRRAVEIDPQYAPAHAFLASFLIQRAVTYERPTEDEDRAEALAAAERAILEGPGDPEVLENAGLGLVHSGKSEKAITTLRRAVEIAPLNFVAWGYLSLVLGWAGNATQMGEAHAILDRIIDQAPSHPSLPYWLCFKGGVLLREGRNEEAAAYAQRCITLQPRFAPGLAQYANALGLLGRFDEAREIAMQMVVANPNGTQQAYMKALRITTGAQERAEPHIRGLIAAGIFKGDVPWPTPVQHDRDLKRPISA